MNKTQIERKKRIEEIMNLVKNYDEAEVVKIVMAKYYLAHRTAKEYVDSAKVHLKYSK